MTQLAIALRDDGAAQAVSRLTDTERQQIEIAEDARERMLCATKQVQDGRLDVSALLYEIGQFLTYRSRV